MYMHVEFNASVVLANDPEDFLRQIEITIKAFGKRDDEYVVGKLGITQVLWADAIALGVSLAEVCDCESQGLHEVHSILTEGRVRRFRPDLVIGDVTDYVLFLHSVAIHPSFHGQRQTILDMAFRTFGGQSLIVMWDDTSELSETDLLGLGFESIKDSRLVYRHSASEPPLSLLQYRGDDLGNVARPEHEEWVNLEWGRLGQSRG
jgi:hypothetical protein